MGVTTRMKQLAGLVLVVALFVITTALPAQAEPAIISSFSPTSGPVGTSVTINGLHFTGATSVTFNGTSATFTVNSGSKITATVPSGATTGKISVVKPTGTATSTDNFTVTNQSGPTISGFNPNSGPVGTSVTINGSNFTGATSVKFNGTSATFTVDSASKITATVPSGATTGKITVTTPGGTATSSASFTVTGKKHSRSVSLQLARHLVARGQVTATDGFSACEQSVPVKIQRRSGGRWRTVAGTLTRQDGSYRVRFRDRSGKYRARATGIHLASGDVCGRATSGVRRHRR
jgi:hypothetical protein